MGRWSPARACACASSAGSSPVPHGARVAERVGERRDRAQVELPVRRARDRDPAVLDHDVRGAHLEQVRRELDQLLADLPGRLGDGVAAPSAGPGSRTCRCRRPGRPRCRSARRRRPACSRARRRRSARRSSRGPVPATAARPRPPACRCPRVAPSSPPSVPARSPRHRCRRPSRGSGPRSARRPAASRNASGASSFMAMSKPAW